MGGGIANFTNVTATFKVIIRTLTSYRPFAANDADMTFSMMDNIIASKLYRAGSVGYISKSGGMSNELNSILSFVTNGTYKGIAIGDDLYPRSTFIDHLLRYEQDPYCNMLVLLGEVGGIEEYRVIEAVKKGVIKKPIVAWAPRCSPLKFILATLAVWPTALALRWFGTLTIG